VNRVVRRRIAHHGKGTPVYRLPGLSMKAAAVIVDLAEQNFPDWNRGIGRPKALTLIDALRLSLCRLRRNATYHDLHEDFAVAESTAWDYHQKLVAFLADVLGTTDEELPALLTGRIFLIDGTLIPTFNWRHRKDLLSGKHRKHGVNAQLFVDVHGRIIAASGAFPGSWHDIHCLREAGWVALLKEKGHAVGDSGYQGEPDAVKTPIKRRPGIDLTDNQKEYNTTFARIRVGVEWGVGHAKNWRILTTRYRSDLERIDTDIQAAIGLQKLNEEFSGRRLTFERIKTAVSE
jgi:DDE superfamily endonuclease/Helix-turn-helix of DDE superfamily endonuclease